LPKSRSTADRIFALIIAMLLGHFFIVVQAQDTWKKYWILKDGQQGTAIVTKVLWTGHNAVAYKYQFNQTEYEGEGARNHQDPRYAHVMAGEQSIVYFSASHPWLSLLNRPRTAMVEGLPVVVGVAVDRAPHNYGCKPEEQMGCESERQQSRAVNQLGKALSAHQSV
jgi:hypothetical protein